MNVSSKSGNFKIGIELSSFFKVSKACCCMYVHFTLFACSLLVKFEKGVAIAEKLGINFR